MKKLYSFLVVLAEKSLPLFAAFNPKMKQFADGRKEVFSVLKKDLSETDNVIWFHAASLGEYEQGVPVMEAVKKKFPAHKILLTFFSPSGYEVKKNTSLADLTLYLPLDTKKNAQKFIRLARPVLAVFIKYEIWPNYLEELERQNIKTMLVSGLFRENQAYFKAYGGFLRNALKTFEHIFVQDEASRDLLQNINIQNTTVSGDTRFDRVSLQLEQDNQLDFVSEFKNGELLLVCGSTWPEDETLLVEYVNNSPEGIKFIFAPHNIKPGQIESLQKSFRKKTLLYSEKANKNLGEHEVLIIDTIGLLTKIYSYADIAYVGGAMGKTGLHNILEPATFGVPILIGAHFDKFPEAKKLLHLKGLFPVNDSTDFAQIMDKLISQPVFRKKTGKACEDFVRNATGATQIIMDCMNKEDFVKINKQF